MIASLGLVPWRWACLTARARARAPGRVDDAPAGHRGARRATHAHRLLRLDLGRPRSAIFGQSCNHFLPKITPKRLGFRTSDLRQPLG